MRRRRRPTSVCRPCVLSRDLHFHRRVRRPQSAGLESGAAAGRTLRHFTSKPKNSLPSKSFFFCAEKWKTTKQKNCTHRLREPKVKRERKKKSSNLVCDIFTRSWCFRYVFLVVVDWVKKVYYTILKGALTRPFSLSEGEINPGREGRDHGTGRTERNGRVFSSIFKVIDGRDS